MPQKRNCSEAVLELGPLWESNRLILKCTIHKRRKKKEQSHWGCRKVVKWNHERTEKKDRKGRKACGITERSTCSFVGTEWDLHSWKVTTNCLMTGKNPETGGGGRFSEKKKGGGLHMQFSSTVYQSNISGLPGINPENPEAFTSSLMSLV